MLSNLKLSKDDTQKLIYFADMKEENISLEECIMAFTPVQRRIMTIEQYKIYVDDWISLYNKLTTFK